MMSLVHILCVCDISKLFFFNKMCYLHFNAISENINNNFDYLKQIKNIFIFSFEKEKRRCINVMKL
jgi:hypothetical protein